MTNDKRCLIVKLGFQGKSPETDFRATGPNLFLTQLMEQVCWGLLNYIHSVQYIPLLHSASSKNQDRHQHSISPYRGIHSR